MVSNKLNERVDVTRDPELQSLAAALSAPFNPKDVKFKPQMVKNNRALAMGYIDARLIQDRLDEVLGVENWQDRYDFLPDGSVVCRLRIKLGGHWITKMDVGSPSEQPDSGDRVKAAVSDALKRAAVKFGIGRYLYRLPAVWADYDPIRKQLVRPPQLPAFAIPKAKVAPDTPPITPVATIAPQPKPQLSSATASEEPTKAAHALPINGQELHQRLQNYDAKLASQKLCVRGALLSHVTQAGVKAGYTANLLDWTGAAISFAVNAVRDFEHSLRADEKTPHPQTSPQTAA